MEPKNKLFQCEICQASYQTKQGLKYHTMSIHEGRKPFACGICNTRFLRKSDLKVHAEIYI